MDAKPTATRRQFLATTTAAAAAFTIVPRHVLGGTALRRAQRQGERRDHRRRRPGPDQRARALPGGRLPGHRAGRSGPGVGPDEVVLRRQGRQRAGKGGSREALRREDPQPQLRGVRRLPGHAGEGEGDRCRPHRHARSFARLHLDSRDEGGQARVLREAAHPQHPGGPARGARDQGDRRRDPDGQLRPIGRGASPDRGVDQGRRHRRRA